MNENVSSASADQGLDRNGAAQEAATLLRTAATALLSAAEIWSTNTNATPQPVAARTGAPATGDGAPAKAEAKPARVAEKPDTKAEATVKAENKAVEPKADAKAEAKVEAPKETPKAEPAQADESAKAVTEAPAKKDPSRLPGVERPKPELKREGQVAVFISRKDSKLYVRQNFKPVFDAPVTIAASEKLLGTHVFTAEVDKNDPNALRWSVVSVPVTARNAQRTDEDERATRRRKVAAVVPVVSKPAAAPNTNSPAEALDRITVPPDVMAKIAEALTSGASIIVSDQGINQGETGEGTDFIVRLR